MAHSERSSGCHKGRPTGLVSVSCSSGERSLHAAIPGSGLDGKNGRRLPVASASIDGPPDILEWVQGISGATGSVSARC